MFDCSKESQASDRRGRERHQRIVRTEMIRNANHRSFKRDVFKTINLDPSHAIQPEADEETKEAMPARRCMI